MDYNELMAHLEAARLVPVVKLDRVEDALPLGRALIEGGLPVAEVTFRTEAAEESIRQMSREFPNMLVGAGTVINTNQAEQAVRAGAGFLVSPGISDELAQWAAEHKVPLLPGVCTPGEIMKAISYGMTILKFFPAAQYGGLPTIKALAGPFPQVRFMPTGGVSAANICEYLKDPRVIACGGSWMVKDTLIREGNFKEITRLTAEAVDLVKGV